MSVSLADPYRGFAINFSHADKPDDHDLIAYDARNKLNGIPFHSDSSHPPYDPHHHAAAPLLPHPAPHTNGYHDPQSIYVSTHHMPPPPPHYGYELTPPHDIGKRKRSVSDGEGEESRHMDPAFGTRENLPALAVDGTTIAEQAENTMFSSHTDPSTSLPPSAHAYAPPIARPVPQQHHHHRLPPQLLGAHDTSPTTSGCPPSVVGQPGMPDPAPRPRGPKLKFTPEEDALLVELKEEKTLTWKQIADFFPGRTSGTLQVRYCTKLKAKDVIWTDEMLSRLHRALSDYEHDKWRIIAGKVGNGFTPAACREQAAHFQSYELVEGLRHGHEMRDHDGQDIDASGSSHSRDSL